MDRKEFFEWLNTCPTHKWNITFDDHAFVTVGFSVEDDDEDDEAKRLEEFDRATDDAIRDRLETEGVV